MTSLSSVGRGFFRQWRLVLMVALASFPAARAPAALNCGDRFKISTVPTMFDGVTFETIFLTSRAVTIEVETFAQWRPDEGDDQSASLTLLHQNFKGVRVQICALVPPELPNNVDLWKKYQTDVATAMGEGTVVSDQVDTTAGADGVHVLGWDTREARFTRKSPTGELLAIQHHFVLIRGNTGMRIILTAPLPVFEPALDDLRYWFSRITIPRDQ